MILAFELQVGAPVGVLCGLLSGVLFAVVMVSLRYLKTEDSFWLVAASHAATAMALAPIALTFTPLPTWEQLPYLIALGVFQMGIPYVLFARGVRYIGSYEASGIALVEPIANPIWVFLAWGEKPAWWTFVGGLLILVGLTVRYTRRRPERSETKT